MSPTSHAWIINPSLGKQTFGLGGLAGEVIEIWRCVCVCVPTSNQCACYWLFFWVENEKSLRGQREREEKKSQKKSKQPSPTLPRHSPSQIRSRRCAVKWARLNNGLGWKLFEPRAADYQLYWIDAGGLAGQRSSALRLRLRWSEGRMKGGKGWGKMERELQYKERMNTSEDVAVRVFSFSFPSFWAKR